jgi:AcrR family transcriptional regulator
LIRPLPGEGAILKKGGDLARMTRSAVTVSSPKQARSKRTREKIVQAAIKLFQERGYEKTTSNDIAAEAGVSVGSFYVYFADKRQLLLTIFDRMADELFNIIFDGLRPEHLFESDLKSRIKEAVAKAVDDRDRNPGLHRVICELVLKDAEFAEKQRAIIERSTAKIYELISLAKKAGLTWDLDLEAAAFIVHRVVHNLAQDYVTGCCEFDRDRAIEALSEMIYRYVFKPTATLSVDT